MLRSSKLVLLTLMILLTAGACSSQVNQDWIASAGLYADKGGTQPTDSYEWLDPFYLVVRLNEPPLGTDIQASWIAVDTNRAKPNTVIKIDHQEAAGSVLVFELVNEGHFWPVGDYQVNLYVNGKLFQEIKFEVTSGDIT